MSFRMKEAVVAKRYLTCTGDIYARKYKSFDSGQNMHEQKYAWFGFHKQKINIH